MHEPFRGKPAPAPHAPVPLRESRPSRRPRGPSLSPSPACIALGSSPPRSRPAPAVLSARRGSVRPALTHLGAQELKLGPALPKQGDERERRTRAGRSRAVVRRRCRPRGRSNVAGRRVRDLERAQGGRDKAQVLPGELGRCGDEAGERRGGAVRVGCADGVVRLEGVIESSTVAAGPSRSFWRAVSGESEEREGRPHQLAVLVASTRSHSLEQSVHSSNRLYRSSPGAVPTERALAQAVHLASSSLVRNISRCETMFNDTEVVQEHKEEGKSCTH